MGNTASTEKGARVRVPPPLVFLSLTVAGVVLDLFARFATIPLPLGARVACGATLALAGVALVAWAVGLFRRSGQDPAPWKPSPSLVLEGPYRFTRNPMYVAMTTIQLGIGLAAGSPAAMLLASVSLLVVHFTAVRPEESYLEERFGEDYRRYKASVRRYL